MKVNFIKKILIILIIQLYSNIVYSEVIDKQITTPEEKEFEWGGGLLFLRINHYRGSDQFKNYYLPLPYFSYVSKHLEAETSFVRGVLYKNNFLAIKLSLSLGFAVESEENDAREGMPDIGYIFETGPMVVFTLLRTPDKKHSLYFSWPVRKVFATDLTSVDQVGIFSVPFLNYVMKPNRYTFGWQLEFSFAVMYGDRDYHDYFYSVDPKYARPGRPEYSADAGYSGVHGTMIGNKKFGNVLIIPFIRYDNLKHVVFEDSPLVKTDHFFLFGFGTFYVF